MNNDPVWQEALQVIAQEVNERAFRMWFQSAVGLGISDGSYCVGVGSEFARDWIEGRFRSLIEDAIAEVLGETVPVKIVVVPALSHNGNGHAPAGAAHSPVETHTATYREYGAGTPLGGAAGVRDGAADFSIPTTPSSSPGAQPMAGHTGLPGQSPTGLSRKYTFDTFVVGPSNRFAHAAALAAAESPGTQYNPLFIYGGVGLGKTHLLQAIGNYVVDNHPGLKVRYLTLETFTNDFINSLRDDTIEGFKARYRTVDVLLLDDIQFLHKKEQTQEEFFHTFNALYDAQKQIVITSDRHPKALDTVEDRLVSRFEWGLITDIQPPDLETRVAILRKKVRAEHIVIADDDVLMLIASRVPSNIRELEGCLTRVVAYSSFTRRPITVDLAREVLKDIPETTSTPITVDMILHAVAHETGVSVLDIIGDKRSRNVVESRHLAMYLARELTDASLPKIGEHFGGRDHTTVLHAVEKISKLMRHDRGLYNRIQSLIARLKSS
ncbi:MAG: chromosomal replication initiator protein DnaA [Thermoleophilia bacterium]|nr:chromosomal replication initiator protein DnaA [Thermoleophilia bacterium]